MAAGAAALLGLSLTTPAPVGALAVPAGSDPAPSAAAPAPSALTVAAAATAAQAKALGTPLGAPPALVEHPSPSAAVAELLARHGAVPTPMQASAIAELDALPQDLRRALAGVVDAFLVVEDATAAAYAHADLERLRRLAAQLPDAGAAAARPDPGRALREAGVDLAPVLSARLVLLDAAASLERAVVGGGDAQAEATSLSSVQTTSTCGEPLAAVAPVLAIDALSMANCYTNDYRLVIDLGGRDVYKNNAGGNGDRTVGTWPYAAGSGALVDVGAQDDQYVSGRNFGTNGGAMISGSGFLYDDGGDDVYKAGTEGTNGGSEIGSGFLFDGWGDDTYTAGGWGTNGGGNAGTGLLVDGAGNDSYVTSGGYATNGGAAGGIGSLVDLGEGTDSYKSPSAADSWIVFPTWPTNGGGFAGLGLLLDAGGDGDTYTNGASPVADQSIVPKGSVGAQSDQCRVGVEGGQEVDDLLAEVCAAVTSAPATVSVNDVSVAEGNAGTATATFTVSLSKAWPVPVLVSYATADGTASAGSDYTATSGTLVFSPMETTKPVAVSVVGDTVTEANETFSVVLTQVAGAVVADGTGRGTILNDDPPEVRIGDVSLVEGDAATKDFKFNVTLSVPTTKVVTASYTTVNGLAIAPGDYTATAGTVSLPAGSTAATITVKVNGDTEVELNETFFVNLSGVTNATVAKAQGKGTIVNDDL